MVILFANIKKRLPKLELLDSLCCIRGEVKNLLLDEIDIDLALENLLQRDVRLGGGDALNAQDAVEDRAHEVFVVHAVELHQNVAVARDEVALHDLGDFAQLLDGLLQQLRVFERDADVGADVEAHHLGV